MSKSTVSEEWIFYAFFMISKQDYQTLIKDRLVSEGLCHAWTQTQKKMEKEKKIDSNIIVISKFSTHFFVISKQDHQILIKDQLVSEGLCHAWTQTQKKMEKEKKKS